MRLEKRLEDVKKRAFLLKNVIQVAKKWGKNGKKLLSLHLN